MVSGSPPYIEICGRRIGPGYPTYIVAELSANHMGRLENAISLVHAAKEAGADAVKLQTYTADTLTIDSSAPPFLIEGGLWGGRTLYDLYSEAHTPWEWHPKLKAAADDVGIHLFSAPFDPTAVDFLEDQDVPAYKVASFEIVDIPLIEYIAQKGKPIIMSTGIAGLAEIDEAVSAVRSQGNYRLALLHCVSAYPAPAEEMNLRTIPHLAQAFDVPAGLSDHSLGITAALGAVALGACMVEKHMVLEKDAGSLDAPFSLDPQELKLMVENIRALEQALGEVHYQTSANEETNLSFRRSLFVVADVQEGELLTEDNVRSIRPGNGLPPKHIKEVLGKRASKPILRGTPVSWELLRR